MFRTPLLTEGESFPEFKATSSESLALFRSLGISVGSPEDPLPSMTDHALEYWMIDTFNGGGPIDDEMREAAKQLGLIDAILPTRERYDYILLDGGSKPVFSYRLDFLQTLKEGGLVSPSMVVFGGQRLRIEADDRPMTLEQSASNLPPLKDVWLSRWLETEMGKDTTDANPWTRPFATEHEIAVLALVERYGDGLLHSYTNLCKDPQSVGPEVPATQVHSEVFSHEGTEVTVLNAPAVIREFRGRKLPVSQARPTARSCFYEWAIPTEPSREASTLLVTHNPNIYRSWLDLLMGAWDIHRSDLQLEGVGAAIEPERQLSFLLKSLGRLLINFYNYRDSRNLANVVPVVS